MPELRPLGESFNSALTGDDDGELAVACDDLVRAELEPATVIRITTILAETVTDEVGTHSGAVTKSLVGTLGHVCGLLSTTMVADVRDLAHRDPLTGLENRRAWDEALLKLDQEGIDAAVSVIDLDGLKKINDEQGHGEGDQHLKKFATDLRGALPDGARAYRFGGDEYGIVSGRAGSASELTELLRSLSALEGVAAFSFGVASAAEDGRDVDALTKAADDRMYVMKSEHRAEADQAQQASAPR